MSIACRSIWPKGKRALFAEGARLAQNLLYALMLFSFAYAPAAMGLPLDDINEGNSRKRKRRDPECRFRDRARPGKTLVISSSEDLHAQLEHVERSLPMALLMNA